MTAYPLLLPVHVLTHRWYPMTEAPPISALSPSELDYEFVKVGLSKWPVRNVEIGEGIGEEDEEDCGWSEYGGFVIGVVVDGDGTFADVSVDAGD
ncbi:hypothetical protein M422DRAFT_265755 [Sphaerobolus stellatus SS14]|uniref:Unplaced genomic scaffold SPHSTscaffold_152, whole genome shotgun sequence n=1 Tax=Sphaerobolus stellatus (strain SS14) TaxID=990650 RepID=A0A0C9UCP4_SPHS4|nr:hypothetical protein M422DRAFT_265755 [Sphaerobolus stellatus SS14]